MIINYITLYMSYIYVYVYIHIIFFPNESVVRYFPSQYWLRGIYIKRDVTVQSSTCEGPEAQSRAQGREGCQGWRNIQGPPGCPGRLHGECSTLKNYRTENEWRVATFLSIA